MATQTAIGVWLRRQGRSRWAWPVLGGWAAVLVVLVCFVDVTAPPRSGTDAHLQSFRRAVHVYARARGRPPGTPTDLGRDVDGRRADAWGRPITFAVAPDGRVTLTILGADGRPGGVGDDRDWPEDPIRPPRPRPRTTSSAGGVASQQRPPAVA